MKLITEIFNNQKLAIIFNLTLFVTALNIADIGTTIYGLSLPNVHEVNPLYGGDSFGFFTIKLLVICVFILITNICALIIEHKKHSLALSIITTLLIGLSIFYIVVVTNNCLVIYQITQTQGSSFNINLW
jgi:hypothetical protein